ncbi:MAG TPA: aminoacyl-tRNA hydrolase [Bacillales bacterium]|nr:aminoacyl-tRNA hydrolase [Bacillales bacterium]
MKVIVGLGNPGFQYKKTRHNVGFMVLDELSKRLGVPIKKKKFNAIYGLGTSQGEKVALVKPLTYMNVSGEAVGPLMNYYKAAVDELVVIYDDLDLPAGKIRLRQKGGTGGHNGMKSIVAHIGTKEFKRIRIGIGRPEASGQDVIDYVLKPFSKREKPAVTESIERAAESCERWLHTPFLEVMNEYNV